jgi:hypothetical protein
VGCGISLGDYRNNLAAKLQKLIQLALSSCYFTPLYFVECASRRRHFFANIENYFKKMAHIIYSTDIVRIFVIID